MNNKHNAKYSFYYLLSLVALIFMAIGVGMISFSIIDKTIPDILEYYNYYAADGSLRFAISALLISTPIFYIISGLINRGLRRGELEKDSDIRRWLTYFIVLVSSLIILGSFIALINSFLSGELTVRFILKTLTVLIISGAVFSFYLYDIKRDNPDKPDVVVKIFFISTLSLVLISFVAAWFFVESPKEARTRRLDEIVVNNISSLESAVNEFYNLNNTLPETIDALASNQQIYLNVSAAFDPETKEPIVYKRLSEKEFEFCATFRIDNRNHQNNQNYPSIGYNKEHDIGYQCLAGNLWKVAEPKPVEKILQD